MDTRGTSFRQVALMSVGADETDKLDRLNTLWAMTMDNSHNNVLAYPEDIIVDRVEELYPRKYINTSEFFHYVSEDGMPWLISESLHIEDIDAFFQMYMHTDEVDYAA